MEWALPSYERTFALTMLLVKHDRDRFLDSSSFPILILECAKERPICTAMLEFMASVALPEPLVCLLNVSGFCEILLEHLTDGDFCELALSVFRNFAMTAFLEVYNEVLGYIETSKMVQSQGAIAVKALEFVLAVSRYKAFVSRLWELNVTSLFKDLISSDERCGKCAAVVEHRIRHELRLARHRNDPSD
jgi:hypothetical protein